MKRRGIQQTDMNGNSYPTKILVVATTPLCVDGLTEVLVNIAGIAKESGKAAVSFALGEGAEAQTENRLKQIGQVHLLPGRKKHLLSYIKALENLVRNGRYDIVHIHGNSSTMALDLFACRAAGIRITHCHNWARQPALKSLTLGTIMNRLVTCPVACSRRAGEALYSKPFTVIRNGINPEKFRFSAGTREAVRKELGLENAFIVGHIGRFTEQKNHVRLIRIFEAVLRSRPEAVLILCGTGELEQEIRQEAARRGLENKARFMGVVQNPQDYLMAMDAFVLPSLFEGLPLVGIEAQATGLHCVFADTITDEAAVLPETEFVSLEEPDEKWAEIICENRMTNRKNAADVIESAGYGMDTVREQVKALYSLS